MVELIPTIIAKSFGEIEEKARWVEPFVKTVQIDIMDGIFTPNLTWPYAEKGQKIRDLENLRTELFLEINLMTEKPQLDFPEWLESKAGRFILHWKALEKIHSHELNPYETDTGVGFPVKNLAKEAHKKGKEIGVALNLEEKIEVLDSFISEIDLVLLMSVEPGFGGQKFQEEILPKISALRKKYPNVKIEVDGGINLGNASGLISAGADFLAVGAAISRSDNIGKTIEEFKQNIL